MGFLAGVVSEINRQEDAATRASEFMQQLLEKRKNAILPELMGRIKARTDKATSRAARVSKAMSFNISKEAASVLESAGQLENALIPLQKLNDDPEKSISADNIAALNEAVIANVPPEKVAGALTYALDNGYAENPSSDLLIEAIYANTEEDFEAALTPLMERASAPGKASPDMTTLSGEGFRINPRSLTGVSAKDNASAKKLIESQVAGFLGIEYMGTEGYKWSDAPSAAAVMNKLTNVYVNQMTDVMIQRDSNDVINNLSQNLYTILSSGSSIKDVSNLEENIFLNPTEFLNNNRNKDPEIPDQDTGDTTSAEEEMRRALEKYKL